MIREMIIHRSFSRHQDPLRMLEYNFPAKGNEKNASPDLLQTLVALGRARQDGENWMAV